MTVTFNKLTVITLTIIQHIHISPNKTNKSSRQQWVSFQTFLKFFEKHRIINFIVHRNNSILFR